MKTPDNPNNVKSAVAFRTISEVAGQINVEPHVLRFWESKFKQIQPIKKTGGRRLYRPEDVQLIANIKKLLHEQGMTIKGVQKIFRTQGVQAVRSGDALVTAGAAVADGLDDDTARPASPEAYKKTLEILRTQLLKAKDLLS